MDVAELRRLRLLVQGLRTPFDASAPEVVRRFVAVQAQEFLPAQWGLAMRIPSDERPDAAALAASLDAGEILRTHVLRPTWHFLHPADARWLLELSAERVHRVNATYYRRTGVEGEQAARALDVVAGSLAGGHRTRAELAAALEAAGTPLSGLAFGLLLMLAELERVAISGPNVGKQRTYAAFDDRVPSSPARPRDEALADLAARFIASRSPVTDRDFAAWSGFPLSDTRTAFAAAAELAAARGSAIETVDVDGVPHWLDAASVAAAVERGEAEAGAAGAAAEAGAAAAAADAAGASGATDPATGPRVDLLQAYDEYIMGYAAPRAFLLPAGIERVHAESALHALTIDGVMAGRWAPLVQGRRATARVVPWRTLTAVEERAVAASVAGLERFLGVPVTLDIEAPVAP